MNCAQMQEQGQNHMQEHGKNEQRGEDVSTMAYEASYPYSIEGSMYDRKMCCRNCRYFRLEDDYYDGICMLDDFNCPSAKGWDFCEDWEDWEDSDECECENCDGYDSWDEYDDYDERDEWDCVDCEDYEDYDAPEYWEDRD